MKQPLRRRLLHLDEWETERKRTEEKLHEAADTIEKSQNHFRCLVQNSSDIIIVLEADGTISYLSPSVERILGYRPEELAGKNAFEYVHPEDAPVALARFAGTLKRPGSAVPIDFRVRDKDGSWIYFEAATNNLPDYPNIRGIVVNARDITERKRTEAALRESQEKLRLMFESITDGITITDLTGNITQLNDSVVRLHGYDSKQEIIGRSSLDLIAKKDRARAMEHLKRTLEKGFVKDIEYTFLSKDGREFHAELSAAVLKDGGGNPQGFIAITKDISKRKQAEVQLLAYHRELRSLASQLSLAEERERRRIAMEMHDRIGQTLTICRMKLGALVESTPSSRFAQPLGEIHTLIKQLIEETRSLTFELSSPLLYEFGLEAAVERLTEQIQEQYDILSHFEDDSQPKPLDDDVCVLLFQTVRELLVNVTKHAQARNVRVRIKRDDANIQIVVEDDGVGFDTSGMSSYRKRAKGFGLFSIHERLHYIDGQIKVESEHGRGTQVTLLAPLKCE